MRRKGSTLIESSVILLTFLVILIMLMDAGQILFFHQFLSDRARAGARYAAVHTFNATTIKNVVVFENTAPASGTAGLFGMNTSMVSATRYGSGTATDRVVVQVSGFKMRFLTPWLAGVFTPGPFSAVMPMESAGTAQ
jgi:hypothetical protein